ncbi:acyl-CoA dehydrogenase family protein [Actinacidiphila glaucinigra]|uniref:acyl-CoA dehydrogenase family protein n=1 Tax=Actinacidiphila glaucinigra TaxID=235986 RepID=UPI0036A4CA64
MDFSFSEEQLAAVEAARAVFSGVAPEAVPSPALTAGAVAEDFDRPLWRRLASADLLGLVLDETYGGAGLDPVALFLVLREAGCTGPGAAAGDLRASPCRPTAPRSCATGCCRGGPRRPGADRRLGGPHRPRRRGARRHRTARGRGLPAPHRRSRRPPRLAARRRPTPPSPGPRTPTTSWSRPPPPAAAPSSPSCHARRSPRPSRSRRAVSATP